MKTNPTNGHAEFEGEAEHATLTLFSMTKGRNQPKGDAEEFSKRLEIALDHAPLEAKIPQRDDRPMSEEDEKVYGRRSRVASLLGITPASAGNYFNGKTMPAAHRVLELADICRVSFMWLYFGRGNMNDSLGQKIELPPSHAGIPDPEILAEAYRIAYGQRTFATGKPYRLERDPMPTVSAYEFLLSGEGGDRSLSEVTAIWEDAIQQRVQPIKGDEGGTGKSSDAAGNETAG